MVKKSYFVCFKNSYEFHLFLLQSLIYMKNYLNVFILYIIKFDSQCYQNYDLIKNYDLIIKNKLLLKVITVIVDQIKLINFL